MMNITNSELARLSELYQNSGMRVDPMQVVHRVIGRELVNILEESARQTPKNLWKMLSQKGYSIPTNQIEARLRGLHNQGFVEFFGTVAQRTQLDIVDNLNQIVYDTLKEGNSKVTLDTFTELVQSQIPINITQEQVKQSLEELGRENKAKNEGGGIVPVTKDTTTYEYSQLLKLKIAEYVGLGTKATDNTRLVNDFLNLIDEVKIRGSKILIDTDEGVGRKLFANEKKAVERAAYAELNSLVNAITRPTQEGLTATPIQRDISRNDLREILGREIIPDAMKEVHPRKQYTIITPAYGLNAVGIKAKARV